MTETYGYTIVTCSRKGIRVRSTDQLVLKFVKDELRKSNPRCFILSDELKSDDPSYKLPNGEYYFEDISKLK